jgi:3-dehydroquinate synthetase
MGITDRDFAGRVRSLLRTYGFRLSAPARFDELLPAMERDKKRRGGTIRLVIPHGMGDVRLHEASPALIAEALADTTDGEARAAS